MDQGNRKKKRSSKRSSILKIGRSPPRGALCDLDPNAPLEDDTKKLRLSRRVSFAETCQVKEFLKDSWNNSGNQQPPPGVDQSAGSENVPKLVVGNENSDPNTNSLQGISGLDTLLNGQIKSSDSAASVVMGLDIGNIQDDDVFLPDRTFVFKDGAELEITKCIGRQSVGSSNMTILSQSSMDLTCMNNIPGFSVSSRGDFTNMSNSDMDMTACVTPSIPNPVPGIMITKPSTSGENSSPEASSVASNDAEDSEFKFSAAAFLQKMGSIEVERESSNETGDVQPKIDVSQFLAKISDPSAVTQSSVKPAIYIPDVLQNVNSGTIPKDPYTLSNETDFDTMVNTSVNKYTGISHVNDSNAFGHPPNTEEMAYNNWSTETTRVFGSGSTSHMEMTLISGHETIHGTNHSNPQGLKSALHRVTEIEGETRIFAGDEDTADMDFTACLTANLGQLKSHAEYKVTPGTEITNNPGDVTKHVDTEMEFTLCNISMKNHTVSAVDDSSKVATQALLKKLTSGGISTIGSESEDVDVKPQKDEACSSTGVKIDAQAFLSKLTAVVQTDPSVDVSGRQRTTTEGSEEMGFTGCINQAESISSGPLDKGIGISDKTIIFENEENMEFTTCLTQTLKNINGKPLNQEPSQPVNNKTEIFGSTGENMEFTTYPTKTMTDLHTASENTNCTPSVTEKTKIFSADEENMEFTVCVTKTIPNIGSTQNQTADIISTNSADKTRVFEEDDMEFTSCLQGLRNQQVLENSEKDEMAADNGVGDEDTEDEIVFKKSSVETEIECVQVESVVSAEIPKSRKRSHEIEDIETEDNKKQVNTSSPEKLADNSPNVVQSNLLCPDMISDEAEPSFPSSPVKEQEVTTGLKGLVSRVKKARKSFGTGETTTVFDTDVTLGEMELTTCMNTGTESRENTITVNTLRKLQNHQYDTTRHFQNDELTSKMELTTCVTSSLPSLRERLNEMTRSENLADDVALVVALNKSNQDSSLGVTEGVSAHKSVSEPSKTSEHNNSSASSENIDIMNEMPPSLVESSIDLNDDVNSSEENKSPIMSDNEHLEIESFPSASHSAANEVAFNIRKEVTRDEPHETAIQNMDMTEVREMDDTKAEKSRLFTSESDIAPSEKKDDHHKSIEESRESLLLSVATMNKSLGLLPANISCLEPKVTKGLSSISFVEKGQLSLCDEPPKNMDDFLALLGFHSYNARLCRRSTLAPYSMKAPETLGEHLELASVIEPKVQVYEWACDQMENTTKKINGSNDDVGRTLLSNLPGPLVDVVNPQTSSKVKQMYKPIIRSCKLKAEQTLKDWKTKMVNSELDAIQQEVQIMEKGVQQLRDQIACVDRQLEDIDLEKGKILAKLNDIEKEEPASDEQVQQFEDCEEQMAAFAAELEENEVVRESLKGKLDGIQKEKQAIIEETSVLQTKINNCETPQNPAISLDDLHDHIDNIHSCTEWELRSISDDQIVISWLFNSLNMEIELAPSTTKKANNRYITSIKFTSQLSDTAAPWAFLAQRMVTKAVSLRTLDGKYPTTNHLGRMLEELSPIVWNARVLGDEMSDTCLFHDTFIDGCKVTIKFVSLAAFVRFRVTFKLLPGKYPNEALEWDLDCDVGDIRREDLEPVISACAPGQLYMHRLVKSIQSSLEKRTRDLKVQF